ncbi:MAG: PepSY domain-containing protein [Pseudomonadota bacterium]
MRSSLSKQAKRSLFLVHRWLGVVTCLFCVMWFLSGLVMLYVPYPSWSNEERIVHLPPVDVSSIRVLPDAALARAGIASFPTTFRIETYQDAPVYRLVAAGQRVSLSAVTGEIISDIEPADAKDHVRATFPNAQPEFVEWVDYDQWTVSQRFNAHRPLLKFALNDQENTFVYVSSSTGEIVQNATRNERVWNWLGAVPHWIYFTPIRKDAGFWRQVVMWSSGPLVVGAIVGLWIGILRVRFRRRYSRDRVTPYQGWKKWHHVFGLLGGLFLTTWIFSGWLSVNPFGLFARTSLSETQQAAYAGWQKGMVYGVTKETLARLPDTSTEISFGSVDGQSTILLRSAEQTQLLDAQSETPPTIGDAELAAAAQRTLPGTPISSVHRLDTEDVYWYSHHRKRPLPVVRVTFADPSATWLFVNPATAEIAGLSDRSARAYRWLFYLIHNYDLPVLLRHQPARDLIVWVLSLFGLIVGVTGTTLGYRALRRRRRVPG